MWCLGIYSGYYALGTGDRVAIISSLWDFVDLVERATTDMKNRYRRLWILRSL